MTWLECVCSAFLSSYLAHALSYQHHQQATFAQRNVIRREAEKQSEVKRNRSIPALAFLKTHKTAGSTIANILHRFGYREQLRFMLPYNCVDFNFPGPFPGGTDEAELGAPAHQYDILTNHAVFNIKSMRSYLKPHSFFFTVIREPMGRLESAFNFYDFFWSQGQPDLLSWNNLMLQLEANQICDKDAALLVNSQARDLGWYEKQLDSSALKQWLRGLEGEFDLVMIEEYFDEGLVMLNELSGIPLTDLAYLSMKTNPHLFRLEGKARENATNLVSLDIPLYKYFKKAFLRMYKSGGTAMKEQRKTNLKYLRLLTQQLTNRCSETGPSNAADDCPDFITEDSVRFTRRLMQEQGMSMGPGCTTLAYLGEERKLGC